MPLISGSDQSKNLGSEKDPLEPSTSRARLIVVDNTPAVQMDVEPPQPIVEDPQVNDEVQMDQVVQELPIIVEQQAEPPAPQEPAGVALRRSTRIIKSAIPSDYIVYLQESDYNIGAENDPKTFSQAMNSKESELWYNVMNEEMNSMKSKEVSNLVELPNGVRVIGFKWVFKRRKSH